MGSRSKRTLFALLRMVICGAALWFVARGVTLHDHVVLRATGDDLKGTIHDRGDFVLIRLRDGAERTVPREAIAEDAEGNARLTYGLKTAWRQSSKGLLFLALWTHFPVTFLLAWRLKILLRVQAIALSYWECVKVSFAGNFLNFATPLGSNAGDVFKAYFVTTHTDRKTEAATTILLDRILGLGTLVVCVAAIVIGSPGDSRLALFRSYLLGILGIGVACAFLYFSPAIRRRLPPATGIPRWSTWDHLLRIDRTARRLASQTSALAAAILLTLLLQGAAIGAYFVVAVAVGMEASHRNVLEYYAYFYTGAVIQALPGPPQGLGTVELAYRYFLAPFGTPSQIVCVAFLIRVIVLICALPGLLVTLTGSYRPRNVASSPPWNDPSILMYESQPKRDPALR